MARGVARIRQQRTGGRLAACRSATRTAITAASHAVEQRLIRDPLTEGESRDEDTRITFEGPLSVTFKVEPADSTVVIVHICVRHKPQH